MLYHLPSDISEQHNLSMKNLDITQLLLKKLGDWDVELPHPVFLEGAVWKKDNCNIIMISIHCNNQTKISKIIYGQLTFKI